MGVDWVASHPRFGEANKKMKKKIVNIVAEIKENTLDRLLLMFLSFLLGPNSEMATFVGHAPLILQCQGTSYP